MNRTILSFLFLLVVVLSAAAYALTGFSPTVNVSINVTTGGGGGGGPFVGPAGACATGETGTVTVKPSTVCQTMDGFGAMGYNANATVAGQLWGASGLGFSIMRYPVPYYGTSNPCNVVQSSCVTGGNATLSWANNVMAAAQSDLKTLWGVGKYPSVLGSTGDCPLDPNAAAADATFLANFLDSLRIYFSIVPSAMSVENEPDDNFTCPPSTLLPAPQMHDLIGHIGSTFASRSITVPLMMPETFLTTNLPSWLSPTMSDSTTAAYITYEASHQYDGDPNVQVVNNFITNGKHLWLTETSQGNGFGPNNSCNGCWDPSISDGMLWANIIDHWLAGANASAWVWWQPAGCGNPPADNECLESDDDVTISKRAYILGNYAKFIRPGWVMIAASHAPQSNVTVTAFKNPSTSDFVIVAKNSGGGNVSQSFTLNGQTTASVTPWLTSASANLAQQSAVSVGGSTFSYTLIANSVTTFVGTFGSVSAGIPCDVGPNAAKIPAPAMAAGFTVCAANLAFNFIGTDPHGVNWQNANTFVKQCGAAIGQNQAINWTTQAYPNSQSGDYNNYTFSDMPCALVQQRVGVNDPLTNTPAVDNFLMSCDWRATPCESGLPSWTFTSSPFWPSPGAGPNGLGLYQPMYVQMTHHWARGSMSDMAISTQCNANPGSCSVQYNDFWQNDYSGHAVGTELDFWETHGEYVASNDGMDIGSQWGSPSDVSPATTAYRTDGFLITTNPTATERRNCGYIGQSQIDSGVAFGCSDNPDPNIKIIANSSDYWMEDRVHIGCFSNPVPTPPPSGPLYGWIGDINSGSSTSNPCLNPNTKMEHWVSDMQVWECPNYWAAPCYGTVITSEAKTPKKWYAKLLEWMWPIAPAHASGPEPFTHPWRGWWKCPDGSIDPTEKCMPSELKGRGNEWWKACVPGRDDCVWSDQAHIGQRPDDPAKGARGGGYCYTKQPFTCSPDGVVPK